MKTRIRKKCYYYWHMLLLLLVLLLLPRLLESRFKSCEALYGLDKDKWLKGETPPVSFPFQLLSIYSYAPLAFVFQTNLLLGEVYKSATRNITTALNNTKSNPKGLQAVPFSTYFNAEHYIWYWSQHKLEVISSHYYYFCFEHPSSRFKHNISVIQRIPALKSFHSHEFAQLLAENKATFPFPNHHLVTIQGKYKMIGIFNFWNNFAMLNYAHQSLKPALPIAKFSEAILKILTNNFIAIHLRVDEEAFPAAILPTSKKSLATASPEILEIMNYIKYSHCFSDLQHLNYELYIDPPAIYLMTNSRPNSKVDRKKVKYVIEQLTTIGFVNIFTRKRIVDKYSRKAVNTKKEAGLRGRSQQQKPRHRQLMNHQFHIATTNEDTLADDLALYRALSTEQLQYVDMLVSQKSACFIPSKLPTITSYLIKRLKLIQKNIVEEYNTVNQTTYGNLASFRDWGM